MTASRICCCLCLIIVGSIVMVSRTALIGTAVVISKKERKNCCWCSFVCPHRDIYTCTRLAFATNTDTSFIRYRKKNRQEGKKKEKKKRRKKKKTDDQIYKKEKKTLARTYVCFVVFARSFPCRALYCGVAPGARLPGTSSLLSVSRIIINSSSSRQHLQQ